MKLERTIETPTPLWNPIAIVASLALLVGTIATVVSYFDVTAAVAARWTPGREQAILRGLACAAAASVFAACALVALGAALPRSSGRAGTAIAAVLAGPGVVGIAGVFGSLRFLAVLRTSEQLVGVLGVLAASILCGCSLIALALHYTGHDARHDARG